MAVEDYKLANPFATIKCPHCEAESPEGKSYCADCGTPLSPLVASMDSFIEAQVQKVVRNELRDRHRNDLELADAIATRLHRGAKIFALAVGIPLTLLAILLGLAGFKVYSDFSRMVREAETTLKPRLEQAERDAQEAQRKANEARQTVEKATALEAETTARINQLESRLTAQIRDLGARLASASKNISEQEKKLAETNELVKALLSAGQTETFHVDRDTDRIVAIPQTENQVSVYVRLKEAPISQTLELRWNGHVQPKNSYWVQRNLVLLRWGQSLEWLKQNPLSVTYTPDPTASAQVVRTLSARDGRAHADGDPLPLLFR